MGRKIRSWEEYDQAVEEQQERFEADVISKLEQLLRPALRKVRGLGEQVKKRVEGKLLEVDKRSRKVISEWSVEDFVENRLEDFGEKTKDRLLPQAQEAVTLQYFQENVHHLIAYGVTLSRRSQALSGEAREKLYSRLVDQLQGIAKDCPSLRDQLPGIEQLTYRFSYPDEMEQRGRLQKIMDVLSRKKYLPRETAKTLLQLLTFQGPTIGTAPPPLSSRAAPAAALLSPTPVLPPSPTLLPSIPLPAPSPSPRQEIIEYLTVMFELPLEVAENYAGIISLEQLEEFHEHLDKIVGEVYGLRLVQQNPEILAYPFQNLHREYLRALKLVQKEIGINGNRRQDLEKRFGLEQHLDRYTSLEELLKLKQELFTELGLHTASPSPSGGQDFNLEQYKDRLLTRAGLDIGLVRGFTEGKTAHFKGQAYMPAEYFRKNAAGKVEPASFSALWQQTFDELVRCGAISRKHKANPLYRLNPHVDEITNPYLREYMRVTLYKKQILAQEGKITPLIDLDKEEKQ